MACFCLLHQCLEARRIVDGDIRQNLAVQIDARALQPVDELAVGNLRSPTCGVDAHDPKRAKVALLDTPADVAVTESFFDGLLRRSVQLGLGEKVTLRQTKGFVAIISPAGSSFYSRHVFSLFG